MEVKVKSPPINVYGGDTGSLRRGPSCPLWQGTRRDGGVDKGEDEATVSSSGGLSFSFLPNLTCSILHVTAPFLDLMPKKEREKERAEASFTPGPKAAGVRAASHLVRGAGRDRADPAGDQGGDRHRPDDAEADRELRPDHRGREEHPAHPARLPDGDRHWHRFHQVPCCRGVRWPHQPGHHDEHPPPGQASQHAR